MIKTLREAVERLEENEVYKKLTGEDVDAWEMVVDSARGVEEKLLGAYHEGFRNGAKAYKEMFDRIVFVATGVDSGDAETAFNRGNKVLCLDPDGKMTDAADFTPQMMQRKLSEDYNAWFIIKAKRGW